ncbi:MAG: 1-acyl-sn-glycerol-3-phosphate acyltransferase [Burkholderiales bacterium]|jgi:1-acyl-sn-glycerol-3-phosphate acyltransferase|nr:1-acyl-sn-glycerol-3-phosphate acyltransferase [Burkholderiales bacterium]
MIRSWLGSILFALFQAVLTFFFVPFAQCFFWMPPLKRYRLLLIWPRLNLWAARWFCGIRHRVIGLENLPDLVMPHIVLSKHSSTWEVLCVPLVMPRPLCFVAKKELLSIPFFGWGLALAKPITIDRSAGGAAMGQIYTQGEARMQEGFWVILFPEGTRVSPEQKSRYKTGGARLAATLRVPVIPVAHNAGYLWPRGIFGKRAGLITLSIGKPISPDGKEPQQLMNEVETWIEAEVKRLGSGLSDHV